jgi:hypothetical protein
MRKQWTFLVLIIQTILSVSVTILARVSFLGKKTIAYNPNLLLLLTEFCKLILSCLMTVITNAPSSPANEVASFLYYLLPAALYSVSNTIVFYTIGIISPGEFVLLWQSKVATTAILYRFFLKRPIAPMQWLSLGGVLLGVVIIELSIDTSDGAPDNTMIISNPSKSLNTSNTPNDQNFDATARHLAILITLAGATVAAFAGICAQWVYKRSEENIWRQNTRLYLAELMFYFVSIMVQSKGTIKNQSLFHGFNIYCILLIVFQSFLGFGIGFVLKYFDVILGIQSSAAATVLNIFISISFFDLNASPLFAVGSFMVVVSIYTYHNHKVHISSSYSSCLKFANKKNDKHGEESVNLIQSVAVEMQWSPAEETETET